MMIIFKDMFLDEPLGIKDGLEMTISGPITGIYCLEEEVIVGFLDYKISNNNISIETLEFFEKYKRKGYGRATINKLKNDFSNHSISGQSSPYDDIKSFWIKQGAIFNSCTNCDEYTKCGGFECLDVYCDNPADYCFDIPTNTPLLKNEVAVSKNINPNIPVLVIGFEDCEENLDERDAMLKICQNINTKLNSDVYVSCLEDSSITRELNYKTILPDWYNNDSSDFIKEFSSKYNNKFIQIVGMHRELCVTQAATIIKKNIPNIEPIIINNDLYTISATYSLEHGDTIERILFENECLPRNISAQTL